MKQVFSLFKNIPTLFIVGNSISLILMLLIMLYAKEFEPSVEGLFIPPATPPYPTGGLLTRTFQILCSIPPIVCGLTVTLLRKTNTNHRNFSFLFGSTLLTGGFLINEIYRIHILLI
ncbi:MAG: hypothetical protein AAGF26_01680 [Cyanobacteria bacterium P01_G01_bin.49]